LVDIDACFESGIASGESDAFKGEVIDEVTDLACLGKDKSARSFF